MFRPSLLAKTKRPQLRYYHSSPSTWNASLKGKDTPSTSALNPPEIQEADPSAPTAKSIPDSIDQSASSASTTSSQINSSLNEHSKTPVEKLRETLLQWGNERASQFRRKADDFSGVTRARLSGLGAELNKVTGYEEIDALKRHVVEQEARMEITRQAARTAKTRHEQAVSQRSTSQRAVNDLLQRKSSWTDEDLIRFTSIVREDHLVEQEEARARIAVEEAEDAVEKEFSKLMRSILDRYHEEQVWSDKIRSASTYGQLAALGLNLLVFVLAIIVVEPWKRKRLAQTFEKKIDGLNEEYKETLAENMEILKKQLEDQAIIVAALTTAISKMEVQTQPPVEEIVRNEDETLLTSSGIWARVVEDRNFGEAVALGALAASVISAVGWIWLGG